MARTAEEFLLFLTAGVRNRSDLANIRAASAVLPSLELLAEYLEELDLTIEQLALAWDPREAKGAQLDSIAAFELPPDQQQRREASRGTCTMTATRQSTAGTATLNAGFLFRQVTASGKFTYAAKTAPSWQNGAAVSDPFTVEAQLVGTAPNAIIGAIGEWESKPTIALSSVTNITPCVGADVEKDESLSQRIIDARKSVARVNASALQAAVRTVEVDGQRVLFAVATLLAAGVGALYVDDGKGTTDTFDVASAESLVTVAVGGERRLYTSRGPWRSSPTISRNGIVLVEGVGYTTMPSRAQILLATSLTAGESVTCGTYEVYTGVVAEAQRVVYGVPSDPTNYPGYAPDAFEQRVLPTAVVEVDVAGTIVVEEGYDRDTMRETVRLAIQEYLNALNIGAAYYSNSIIATAGPGVRPGLLKFTLSLPITDGYCQPYQVHRAGTITIT